MDEALATDHVNIKYSEEGSVISASGKGRSLALIVAGLFFLLAFVAEIAKITNEVNKAETPIDPLGHTILIGVICVFGYIAFRNLKALLNLNEVLLLPEKRKIVLRRERSKKVVSEHSIDDIRLEGEKVLWDNAVNYTKFFTIYDTRSNKQIFSIRPGTNAVNSAGACNELEEFFNAVMRPEKRKVSS